MKGPETLRETHPQLWLLTGRISINFLKCGKQKTQHLRSRLDLSQFSRVKTVMFMLQFSNVQEKVQG